MEEIWAWNLGVLVPADGLPAMGKVVELSPVCLALTCSRTQGEQERQSWQPHPFGHF